MLFLNKYDVLRAKLRAGVRYADHVAYDGDSDGAGGGDGNDVESVAKRALLSLVPPLPCFTSRIEMGRRMC